MAMGLLVVFNLESIQEKIYIYIHTRTHIHTHTHTRIYEVSNTKNVIHTNQLIEIFMKIMRVHLL